MAIYSRFWTVFQRISDLIDSSDSNYCIFKNYVIYSVRKYTAYWWDWTSEHTLQVTQLSSTLLYSSSLAWGNYKKEKSKIIGWRHSFSPQTLLSLVIKSCKGFHFINWDGYRGSNPINWLSVIIIEISRNNLIFPLHGFTYSSDSLRHNHSCVCNSQLRSALSIQGLGEKNVNADPSLSQLFSRSSSFEWHLSSTESTRKTDTRYRAMQKSSRN